jgi:hypothetical protein
MASPPSADEQAQEVPGQTSPTIADELRASLVAHQALPFLFIGSGLTRRYLALPDWSGLLQTMASEIGEDFDFVLASANGNLPKAASALAHAFHEQWWKDEKWESQRTIFQSQVKSDEGAFKVGIAEFVRSNESLIAGKPAVDDPMLAAEVVALKVATIDGVITTNFDSFVEQIFPSFPVYIGQDELLLSDAQFIAEVYKIHGSATQPQTLVVTAQDYEHFRQRNAYLAAKLLTIFAEHPVIFVGYSINDDYVGEILDEIATAVGPERYAELGRRIYFVEWNEDPASKPTIEQSTLVRGASRLPVTRISTHSLLWVWEVLGSLDRPFPATLVRELRRHVYDLIAQPDPEHAREMVWAVPIDSKAAEGLRVIFGVGAFTDQDLADLSSSTGRSIQLADIETDVLGIRSRALDPEYVLRHGIPEVIRPAGNQYVPVMKYLSESGRIAADGEISYADLPAVVRQLAERDRAIGKDIVTRFQREVAGVLTSPSAIASSGLPLYFQLDALVLLDPAGYELDELRDVLTAMYENVLTSPPYLQSPLRRALCHYDRLRFGPVLALYTRQTSTSIQRRARRSQS